DAHVVAQGVELALVAADARGSVAVGGLDLAARQTADVAEGRVDVGGAHALLAGAQDDVTGLGGADGAVGLGLGGQGANVDSRSGGSANRVTAHRFIL